MYVYISVYTYLCIHNIYTYKHIFMDILVYIHIFIHIPAYMHVISIYMHNIGTFTGECRGLIPTHASRRLPGKISQMSARCCICYPQVLQSWLLRIAMRLLGELDLLGKKSQKASNMSGGQQRRLSLAVALIGAPRVVLLDEVTPCPQPPPPHPPPPSPAPIPPPSFPKHIAVHHIFPYSVLSRSRS